LYALSLGDSVDLKVLSMSQELRIEAIHQTGGIPIRKSPKRREARNAACKENIPISNVKWRGIFACEQEELYIYTRGVVLGLR
jgi:hypothetical protein